jgi:hypothetical protein
MVGNSTGKDRKADAGCRCLLRKAFGGATPGETGSLRFRSGACRTGSSNGRTVKEGAVGCREKTLSWRFGHSGPEELGKPVGDRDGRLLP